MKAARFMIAGTSSGSGKTMLSCALMSALKQKGFQVRACKCGPDYIDPMFHREVLGIESENLDLFFCTQEIQRTLFRRHMRGADVGVIEGVMGYYDGMDMTSDQASSYHVAKVLDIPVILVVPCRGMALSVVPQILGMLTFRKEHHIKGILLNRISERVYPRMKEMIESELSKRGYQIPVVGFVPEDTLFSLESRHLGLVLPDEIEGIRERINHAGKQICETVDLDCLMQIGREGTQDRNVYEPETGRQQSDIKIAVAKDEAFCFYYKDNLECLKEAGCQLIPFSPLEDVCLPEGTKGLLLGGGYPELYARRLSGNKAMRESIYKAIAMGMPCIAECGGFMYLLEHMEGKDGISYSMAGVIQGEAVKRERLVRFGYVELQSQMEGSFLPQGEMLRGHEFHYWDSTANGKDCLAVKPDKKRQWQCIHMRGNVFAGYPHIYFYSNPQFAVRFVEACGKFKPKGD